MKDILDEYGEPERVMQRLDNSYNVSDPEITQLYDQAYTHFEAYLDLVSTTDEEKIHNAGYELEQCKRALNKAEQSIQVRDKTPRGILEPGDKE